MMYNQSRRPNETHEGKHWAKLFESNGAFMMTKVLMTLFQEKHNVQFDYSSMRNFLKSNFEIDSPLPRHEKIEYPYEEHPEAVMREWQDKVNSEGLDPGGLDNDYDPQDPANFDAIEAAIALAERDIENLDKEQIIAETKLAKHTSDVKELADLLSKDVEFERLCKEVDIEPHQYAVWKYDSRKDAAAVPFEDVVEDLKVANKEEIERFFVRKTNEANGIFEPRDKDPAPSNDPGVQDSVDGSPGPDGHQQGGPEGGPYDAPPSSGNGPGVPPGSSSASFAGGPGGEPKKAPSMDVKDLLKQIQQQDEEKRAAGKGAKEGYNPTDQAEKPRSQGYASPAMGMSIRLPFEDRIGSLFSGIVSYPGSKYRTIRDSSVTRKRVVESRTNLLKEVDHIGNNFTNMTDSQKKAAIERVRDTAYDYQKDIKDAHDVMNATGDRKLKDFLAKEDDHAGTLKKAMAACVKKVPELEDLKKFFDSIMDSVKNLVKSLGNLLNRGGGAPAPSP